MKLTTRTASLRRRLVRKHYARSLRLLRRPKIEAELDVNYILHPFG